MAQLWPDEISEDTIGRGLKRIGFTQKKTYAYRERDRKKRQAFLAELETIQPEQRVYLDEAGIDDTEDDGYGWCERGERFYSERRGSRTPASPMCAAWCQHTLVTPIW